MDEGLRGDVGGTPALPSVDAYHRDGCVIIREVFTPEEVEQFSAAVANRPDPGSTDAHLFTVPALKGLWLDQRLIGIARALLGTATPVFFGECNLTSYRCVPQRVRHLHHDAKGTRDNLFNRVHTAPAETYPVVRFGIYLQDYAVQSGGLKVSPGSHMVDSASFEADQLPYRNLDTRPGDVAAFCLRTLHSPFAMRPVTEPDWALSVAMEDDLARRTPDRLLPVPAERDTLFVDYARESEMADLQIKNRAQYINHSLGRKGFLEALDDYDIEGLAQAAGLKLRLDYGVYDAVRLAMSHSHEGVMRHETMPYLKRLPRMVRNSRDWSSHYRMCDATAGKEDTLECGLRLANDVLPRLRLNVMGLKTQLADNHMNAPL